MTSAEAVRGPAVEQGDLAEEVPGARGLEHDALAGVVLEEDLDLAGAHDVERIARDRRG